MSKEDIFQRYCSFIEKPAELDRCFIVQGSKAHKPAFIFLAGNQKKFALMQMRNDEVLWDTRTLWLVKQKILTLLKKNCCYFIQLLPHLISSTNPYCRGIICCSAKYGINNAENTSLFIFACFLHYCKSRTAHFHTTNLGFICKFST